MSLQAQTQALLDLVESDRAQQVNAILGEAQRRADAVHAQAHAEARARMRQAFAEQRLLRRERKAAAQARLDTQRRLRAQQHTTALLRLAWQRLPDELQQLWQDPAARGAWVAQVLASADTRMPRGAWRVVHPADWPADEQQAMAQRVQAKGGKAPQFEADERLRAGLRIAAGGNLIDGSLDGLLAERGDFEARLLRRLESKP